MRFHKILILGCGVVGGHVLDFLSRMAEPFEIHVASRRLDAVRLRVNLAFAVAANLGTANRIEAHRADVDNIDETASLLHEIKPEIVVNATSKQTFWLISTLPKQVYLDLAEARLGPWLPNHLALSYKLMQAVRQSGLSIRVVNAAFPDAVNPVLATAGLAPDVGAGNIANIIPTLQRGVAHLCGASFEAVEIRLVAHHFVGNEIATYGNAGGAPYHLQAWIDGEEVTDRFQDDALFALFSDKLKRTRGVPGQVMASSSVAAVVRAIATDSRLFHHAPGPNGLVGGYPLRIGAGRIELALPEGLGAASAEEINKGGQRFEGIERIDPSGAVHFTESRMETLTRTLGYQCRSMELADVGDWADELRAKYRAYVERLGITAPAAGRP